MKKFFQLAIVLLITTSSALASNLLPSITLKNIPTEKKFSLAIEGMKETAEITLTDTDGRILLSQDTKGRKEFVQIFDLNQLPAGEYFITVQTSLRKTVQPITLSRTEVLVDTDKKREFFSPVIRLEEGYVDVSLFNGRIADVTINILDADNEQVFREKLENVLVVEKRYHFEQLPWGRYTIQVITPEDRYFKTFQVR